MEGEGVKTHRTAARILLTLFLQSSLGPFFVFSVVVSLILGVVLQRVVL